MTSMRDFPQESSPEFMNVNTKSNDDSLVNAT